MITLTINNKSISVPPGTSILAAARRLGIDVPTLCYMDGLPHNTSCMICVVEEKKSGKLLPSCSARAEQGMHIESENERIREFRQDTLDLLLSEHIGDCQAPCQRICPAYMDIPLMIRHIQRFDWRAALRTIKDQIALPAVLGRICPAPCENGCNRKQYDKPISICLLKRYVADIDLASEAPFRPKCATSTGKQVAIVGSGPCGLSAAYYLAQLGHHCTLFDKREKPGGNLRYAIPDDHLPKEVLDAEIEQIKNLGVEFSMQRTLGADFSIGDLQKDFAAVILANGETESSLWESEDIQRTDRGLKIDRKTHQTTFPGIFAGGSVVSSSQMAVRAVGHGKTIAYAVDQYVMGKPVVGRPVWFNSLMGRLKEGEVDQFLKDAGAQDRIEPAAGEHAGFVESEAVREAQRCFHCDCRKQASCKLRLYSDIYHAAQNRFKTSSRKMFERHVQHDLVIFEPGKCIKCGLCVEITAQAGERFGFTFINRGFDVKIAIPFHEALQRGLAKVAQQCAEACPTAAISLRDREETVLDNLQNGDQHEK